MIPRPARSRPLLAAALGALPLVSACQLIPAEAEGRCRALTREVDECIGVDALPLQCDSLSDGDVDTLADLLDTLGCDGLAGLLPLDGDPLAASCALFGEGCREDALPTPVRVATRYPLVLVNGIDVSPLFSWSDRIVDELGAIPGQVVELAVVPPYDSTAHRTEVLWERVEAIRAETGAPRVNLLCHSLGGLDCRYLVSPAGLAADHGEDPGAYAALVASVTTVSTAHYGTPVADVALGYLVGEDPEDGIDALATTLGGWFSGEALDADVDLRASIVALTTSQAEVFNARIVDADGVYYQSWGGFSRPFGEPWADRADLAAACAADDPGAGMADGLSLYTDAEDHLSLALLPSYDLVAELAAEGDEVGGDGAPSDGLCPVRSARWGVFRGCVPVDHQEQLGRGNIPDVNVRNRLDMAAFYAAVAADLAERGY